ncbi:hypothetical protein OBBRIDRAFT_748132 [Obba rivulosa]|uniref:Glycosyltransferase family 25 protein n=1 Tax=Obba rivulosa TaxID=1052685 RepID=A0A8E2DR62_9APHY|nr:hypothetical protein OBBRIDRAFT_748132 [Obba rivulosa]
MERLRQALDLQWTYIDAVHSDDPAVSNIVTRVRLDRSEDTTHTPSRLPGLESNRDDQAMEFDPLTCATRNYITGRPWAPSTPTYMVLSPAKVACWYSHLQILRFITADAEAEDDVTVILEDDIDMEHDIRERLKTVWGALPPQWDIVFLGHCWSNESTYPAVPTPDASMGEPADYTTPTTLHPSFAPKCTHAYALSRTGARRLLLHLRHPHFAYSRAYDQALAWLVLSGRLKAFSVVPSVVVQRKVDGSDIDAGRSGMGSPWRETLMNGVLGS